MLAIRRGAIGNDDDCDSAVLNPEKIVQDPLERVRCLLDRRPAPCVDAVNAAGETALMIAVRAAYAQAVRLLLVQQPGPSLDVRNRAGQTAKDILAALVAAQAESASESPVQDAAQSKVRAQTAQQLVEIKGMLKAYAAGKSVDSFLAEHFGVEIAAFLVPNLLDAARRRDRATVSYCLAHGTDINAADKKYGNTALLLACDAHAENDIGRADDEDNDDDDDDDDRGNGRFSSRDNRDDGRGGAAVAIALAVPRVPALAPPPFDIEFARFVLRTPRCNANAQNRAGNSALMLAASGGAAYWPLLELLCARASEFEPPVNLALRNRAGCTALMLAALIGNEPAVRALLAMRPPPSVHAMDAAGQTAIDMAKTEAIRRLLREAPAPPVCCAIA